MTLKETIEERIDILKDELPAARHAALQAYQEWMPLKAVEDQMQNELESLEKILESMP